VHELADMPASGFDDQLPRSDGALGDEGAGVGGAAAGLGASTLADSRSTPVQAPVSAAVIRKQRTMNRCIFVTLAAYGVRTRTV